MQSDTNESESANSDTTHTGRSASAEQDTRGPGVKIPPPLVFVLCLIAASGLQALWPQAVVESVALRYVGATVCIVVILSLLGMGLMFHRHKTAIEPWKPTTRVMSHGPYSFSRNPIYVGFCFLVLGIGLAWNSLWLSLSFIPAVVIVYFTAIRHEEKYLEKKFGEEYRRYKEKVRRWL